MELITLKIYWLGNCPTCDREEHTVSTYKGTKNHLYEDDTVKCWCGQTGVIEVDDGHAWCNWDKKDVSELDKFNNYYREKYPEYWELLPKANHQACSHHEELFNSWVAAKSKAVPEGFVLVPKASLKVALSWMDADIDPWQMGGDSFLELYEHKPILEKAMIEAQEQSHE
jgi:hypothetical protein